MVTQSKLYFFSLARAASKPVLSTRKACTSRCLSQNRKFHGKTKKLTENRDVIKKRVAENGRLNYLGCQKGGLNLTMRLTRGHQDKVHLNQVLMALQHPRVLAESRFALSCRPVGHRDWCTRQ